MGIPWLDMIQGWIMTSVAVTGVIVAILGLRTWRRQLRGRTEYELARRLLRAVYTVRDELAYVRGPFVSAGEIAAAVEEAGLDADELEFGDARAIDAVRARRWKGLAKAMSNLQLEALEAEVLWGDAVVEQVGLLRQCVHQLQGAVNEYAEFARRPAPNDRAERERQVEIRRVIHGSGSESDEFWTSVTEAVGSIERFLHPHLEL